MRRSIVITLSLVCLSVGFFTGFVVELYSQNNSLLLAAIAISLAIVAWVGSGSDILGLLRDMYKDSQEAKRKPTLGLGDILVVEKKLEKGRNYNEHIYTIRTSILRGEGIVDDCHLYLDIKGTKIRHFPTVWMDSNARYMPISEFEDARLFSISDYSGKQELVFWSTPLNPSIEYPIRAESVPLDEMLDKELTVTVRARNANLPEPLRKTVKEIIKKSDNPSAPET
jgi:hypothetical protein